MYPGEAANGVIIQISQYQCALGGTILTAQRLEFLFKILEGEVYAYIGCIFLKKRPRQRKIRR